MTTVTIIDTNQRIVELQSKMQAEVDGGNATPYFEELWYSLTICLEEIQAELLDHEQRLVAGGL
jgi:hypothetical protein